MPAAGGTGRCKPPAFTGTIGDKILKLWGKFEADHHTVNIAFWVPNDVRRKDRGETSFGKGVCPQQANIYLHSGDTNMNSMVELAHHHPLTLRSSFEFNGNKVTKQAPASSHESTSNCGLTLLTVAANWNIEFGYTRHGDADGITHAWVKFGSNCGEQWKKQVTIDFMLAICRVSRLMTVAPVPVPRAQQWVPKAISQASLWRQQSRLSIQASWWHNPLMPQSHRLCCCHQPCHRERSIPASRWRP